MTLKSTTPYQPSYLGALLAGIAVLLIYLFTLAPTVAMWDAGEYMAGVKVLGVPHPPGNPLFVMIGHVAGLLPLPIGYAARLNVMNAFCSALAAGIWFLIAERIVASWFPARWQRLATGFVTALIGATAFSVWNQSVVSEKVYMVSLAIMAGVSWLAITWAQNPDGPSADRRLVLIAYCLGLGYTVHPAGFLPIPAIAAVVAARRWRTFLRGRLILACVGAIMLGLTPFMFESVRSAHFPRLDEGEPTACVERIAVSCTFSAMTSKRLMDNINRKQYGEKIERGAPYSAQLGMWWLYFRWQWLRDLNGNVPSAQLALAMLFLVLGVYGGVLHWRSDRVTFWYMGPLMFTLTFALVYYLNFKYGASQAPALADTVRREVRDRDYFFVWSFSAFSVWAGVGLTALWQRLSSMFLYRRVAPRRAWIGSVLATPVLAVVLIPLVTNWNAASRHGETFTREWAVDVLNSVEPYGILIANGDNDTFPLWYAQEVEGVRQDVLVTVTSYLGVDWFLRQIVRNPVRPYDVTHGPTIYRSLPLIRPSGPPLAMTFADIDALPEYITVQTPQLFHHDAIKAVISPGDLMRDQLVTLHMIRDSFPRRPIYFTNGSYARTLGLGPYLERQGVLEKLVVPSVGRDGDTETVMYEHVNVKRTLALWRSYRGPEALMRQRRWVDRPSISIPYTYVIAGDILAQAQAKRGDQDGAAATKRQVEEIARVAGIQF